jgi:NAD(P)-dependent dehydrogenase (short-subunit alcohol dehydrogenase family)
MKRNLAETVVLITGASSGIGRATAQLIAQRGGSVVLVARTSEALNEVARECEQAGGRALAVPADVTDEAQVKAAAQRAIEHFGRVDVWVNDAAVSLLASFEEAPPDAFRRVIETNFFGYVHGARAILPHFRERKQGILINVASVMGKIGAPYATAYVASKFAVTGFSESLRMELQNFPGIHVCTVLPATIDTPLFQHAANFTGRAVNAPPPVYAPEEVAEAIVQTILRPQREVAVGNTRRMVAMRTLAPLLPFRTNGRKQDRKTALQRPAQRAFGGEPV